MARPLDPLSLKTLRARLASLDDELDLYPGQLPQPTLMLMLVRILRGWFDDRVEPDAPEAAEPAPATAGAAEPRDLVSLTRDEASRVATALDAAIRHLHGAPVPERDLYRLLTEAEACLSRASKGARAEPATPEPAAPATCTALCVPGDRASRCELPTNHGGPHERCEPVAPAPTPTAYSAADPLEASVRARAGAAAADELVEMRCILGEGHADEHVYAGDEFVLRSPYVRFRQTHRAHRCEFVARAIMPDDSWYTPKPAAQRVTAVDPAKDLRWLIARTDVSDGCGTCALENSGACMANHRRIRDLSGAAPRWCPLRRGCVIVARAHGTPEQQLERADDAELVRAAQAIEREDGAVLREHSLRQPFYDAVVELEREREAALEAKDEPHGTETTKEAANDD